MPRKRLSGAQKRFNDTGVTFAINIDGVLEVLAAGQALSESMKDPRYIDAVVDEAFDHADEAFNLDAAAFARTGAISHMYEWGTVGINRGRSNMRVSPMSHTARLWTNFAEGKGLDRTLWYAYRPSVATVPKPTAADTGMSTEVIRKMRDHTFRWKAQVMEEGQEVTISPKKAKFLLIPAYEQNRPYMRPNDIKRGYALTKGPVTVNPGRKFAGNFSGFWAGFWHGKGEAILNEQVTRQILSDYEPELTKPRASNTLRPVGHYDVKTAVKSKKKKIKSRVTAKAQARRMNK